MPASGLLEPAFLRKLERLSLVAKKVFTGQLKGELCRQHAVRVEARVDVIQVDRAPNQQPRTDEQHQGERNRGGEMCARLHAAA